MYVGVANWASSGRARMLSPTSHRRADAHHVSPTRRRLRVRCPAAAARRAGRDAAADISVIPRPESVVAGRGTFTLTSRTTIWSDRADSAVARRFSRTPRSGDRAGSARANRDVGERKQNRLSPSRRARHDARSRRVSARRETGCRDDHVVGAGRRVLRDANAVAASSRRHLSLGAGGGADVDDSRRENRGPPALCLARHAPRRVAALHAEGVRQEVHRSHRAAQNELVPLASHR